MKVSAKGEFGLIDSLSKLIASNEKNVNQSRRELILGIGDDAAVWKPSNPCQIATVDSLVEGIHFTLQTITWRELGWKSVAVNLSDIAAMGGIPLYALISLGLPQNTDVADVEELYKGMLQVAGKYGVSILGGDTVSSPFVFISVTVIGCASNPRGKVLRRSAAQPGDIVAVTGELGASAGGLHMLLDKQKFPAKQASILRKAHVMPVPRIAEGQALAAAGVKAGMDISDGLVGDLIHICEMSKVGAVINVDRVPVSKALQKCYPEDALSLALTGGEDYELLFTAPPAIIKKLKKSNVVPFTVIGEITVARPGKVELKDAFGRAVKMTVKGWDHFTHKDVV
jgi:thiamine-monophosphate kinase